MSYITLFKATFSSHVSVLWVAPGSRNLTGWVKFWAWWRQIHFERTQLFHLNVDIVVNQGFSVFDTASKTSFYCNLRDFERPFRSPITTCKCHHAGKYTIARMLLI